MRIFVLHPNNICKIMMINVRDIKLLKVKVNLTISHQPLQIQDVAARSPTKQVCIRIIQYFSMLDVLTNIC
jgi:hypothetical protein